MGFASVKITSAAIGCLLLCLANAASAAGTGPRFKGQVLYRYNKSAVPGVLVELVEAEDDGKPGDEVLGSARADAEGRFVVELQKATDRPVALVVSAVRASARSGGDRRSEGYEIKTHRTVLGFLTRPSPTKSNTVLIEKRERRNPGRASGDSDDD